MTDSDSQRARGVLPDHAIRALIASGGIAADAPYDEDQVQPASLDLRLGHIAYRVRASFLTGKGRRLSERLPEFEMHRMPLDAGAVLEKGCVYVVPLMERLACPPTSPPWPMPKAPPGRVDCLTRVITDGGTEFDRIAPGYTGPLLCRDLPALLLRAGEAGAAAEPDPVSPGGGRPVDADLSALHAESPLVAGTGEALIDDGLGFSVDLTPGPGGLVGYRAKPHTGVIDLTRIGAHDDGRFLGRGAPRRPRGRGPRHPRPRRLLHPRQPRGGHIPPDCAAEMAPYLAMVGEFRVHYAGFFDPGFGHGVRAGRAGCWRCAATRRPSSWNTGRSWDGLSTNAWPPCPSGSMART
jgi:dCTP deaminase